MTRKISLAALTLTDEAPPDLIRIAAEAGYEGVSLSAGLASMKIGRRSFSLLDDPPLRRETARALAETGMTLDLIEGISLQPDVDLGRIRSALEMMKDLGGTRLNTTTWDPDTERWRERLARVCDLAAELGLGMSIEFTPLSQLASLADAVALVESGRYQGLQILMDSLHLARCGATPADMAALDPDMIGFAQICDGPAHSPSREAYMDEALYERGIPGEGELPMRAFIDALPAGMLLSVETPLRGLEQQGVPPLERARRALDGVRRVMN